MAQVARPATQARASTNQGTAERSRQVRKAAAQAAKQAIPIMDTTWNLID